MTFSKSISFLVAYLKDGRPPGLEHSPTGGSGQPTVIFVVYFVISFLGLNAEK